MPIPIKLDFDSNDQEPDFDLYSSLFPIMMSSWLMPQPLFLFDDYHFHQTPYIPPLALEKDNDKTKIKKFHFKQRDNGNFFIQVTMKSKADAKALAALCKKNGLEEDINTADWLHFECADPQVMAYFAELVCAFDNNAQPQLLSSVYDNLKMSPNPDYQLPLWYRDGNYYHKFFERGSPLVRIVHYRSTSPKSLFKEVSICGYSDNSVQIRVQLKNTEGMAALSKALKNENLVAPEKLDFICKSTGFSNHDMNSIAHYLSVINKVDPTFFSIQKDIEKALNINLNQDFHKRAWVITGDFDKVLSFPGSPLCQQLKLDYTANNQRALKSVELLGYKDNTLKMNVSLKEGHRIHNVLANAGRQFLQLQLEKSFFDNSVNFVGSKTNPNAFVNVLRLLKQLTGSDFRQVEQLLLETLKIKMRSLFTQSINDLKKSKAQTTEKSKAKQSKSHADLSLKDKMNVFFAKVKTELGIVADVVEETMDIVCQDVNDTVDELATELEKLVLEAGEGLDETFDALESCIAPLTHLFDCLSVSNQQQEQRQRLLEQPYAAAELRRVSLK